jgi:hypothetical protein
MVTNRRPLPTVVSQYTDVNRKDGVFQQAFCRSPSTLLRQVANSFNWEADTDIGMGSHYLVELVGSAYTGGSLSVRMVTKHHAIPLLDLSCVSEHQLETYTIRDLVKYMLATPPRCALMVDLTRDPDGIMHKVIKRIGSTQMDLRYRRVIFCLVLEPGRLDTPHPPLSFPGTVNDRMGLLLYRIPAHITKMDGADDGLQRLAKQMQDYSLFEPSVWKCVKTDGTLDEFLSTSVYQVIRRNMDTNDRTLQDDFPSFEVPWRRALATTLQQSLVPPPEMTSSCLHRVVPVGVSSEDALHSIQVAMPEVQDPYSITVVTEAVDDTCGSIAITQPFQFTVVNITCTVDPKVIQKVCSELRTGHRAVVHELAASNKIINELVTRTKSMQEDISRLVQQRDSARNEEAVETIPRLCQKSRCPNMISGTCRQCEPCRMSANNSRKKRKTAGTGLVK